MFTLFMDFGSHARTAIEAGIKAYKPGVAPGIVASASLDAVKDWNPKFKGKPILTQGLRLKLAQALGELAYNIAVIDKS